jgi:hypothetical protein
MSRFQRLAVVISIACVVTGAGAAQKDGTMTSTRAKGEFDVKLTPQPSDDNSPGAAMGRMTIDKVFRGDLAGTSKGEMLTAMAPTVKNSGVYVAVERVTGTLNGRMGSFALHHTGIMDRGSQSLAVTVVPDSGTDELVGITGKMNITIDGSKHFYELEYQIR